MRKYTNLKLFLNYTDNLDSESIWKNITNATQENIYTLLEGEPI